MVSDPLGEWIRKAFQDMSRYMLPNYPERPADVKPENILIEELTPSKLEITIKYPGGKKRRFRVSVAAIREREV